jgi:hypothetical protein
LTTPIYSTNISKGTGSIRTFTSLAFTTNYWAGEDPNTFTSSAVSNSGFTVSWSGGTNVSEYIYTLNDAPTTPTIDNGLSNGTITFTGLSPATLYKVSITSKRPDRVMGFEVLDITCSVLVETLA